MPVQRLLEIGKDRETPGQIGKRGIGGIARIAVLLAPVLARLVILCDGVARGLQLARVDLGAEVGQFRAVEAGDEEGLDFGHGGALSG